MSLLERIYVITPGAEIKNPINAEVPIALWIDLEKALRVGTLKLPPPIPIITERNPIILLIKKFNKKFFGISFAININPFWKNILM